MDIERRYRDGDREYVVQVRQEGEDWVVTVDGRAKRVRVVQSTRDELVVSIEGRVIRGHVAAEGERRWVATAGRTYPLTVGGKPGARSARHAGEEGLAAVMPGHVVRVLAEAGQPVEKGQPLVILEAMKMEIKIAAPHAGRVSKVHCREGQVVERGQVLVEITAADD